MTVARILEWAYKLLFVILVVLTVLSLFTALDLLDSAVIISRMRGSAIGMTERDVLARFGQPTNTLLPGDDTSQYWTMVSDRPISGKLLMYVVHTPSTTLLFHDIYLSKAGTIECSLIHEGV